jgi:hypothetical protein
MGRTVRVFLSYRRGDVGGYAGRLADALHQRLGPTSVFQDVVAIAPGQDYTAAIDRALDESDAVLAVIGPGWLRASTPRGAPRLFEPDDYVRLETARALQRDVRVVPILVGGASLPAATDLPQDLQALPQRQAVVLHDETWHQDLDGLVRSLRGEPVVVTKRRRRWLLAALAGVVVIGLGVAGWAVWGSGGGKGSSGGSGGQNLPRCELLDATGWTRIPLSNDPTGQETVQGGSLAFTVKDAGWRPHGTTWQVTLETSMENKTGDYQYHADYRYKSLIVGQREFDRTCYASIADTEVVAPGTVGDALIGFDIRCKPVGHIQLVIEDDKARINVTPNTLEPGNC